MSRRLEEPADGTKRPLWLVLGLREERLREERRDSWADGWAVGWCLASLFWLIVCVVVAVTS